MNSLIFNGRIDLHTHSTASDGSFSPTELVRAAVDAGLTALALTDHDTTEGDSEAEAEAQKLGITFVPGVEISCNLNKKALHILGFWVDYNNRVLNDTLSILVDYRTNRNRLIISRLRELGMDITYEEVAEIAGNEVVGRPHIAEILVRKGVVSSIQEAFDEYLGEGKKAHFHKKRLTAEEGIYLINKAGGIACLAHPKQYNFSSPEELRGTLKTLRSWGLAGLEVFYPTHSPEDNGLYKKIAEEFDLAMTGGSDFHGTSKPKVKLGSGINGNMDLDWKILENLKRRHREFSDKNRIK